MIRRSVGQLYGRSSAPDQLGLLTFAPPMLADSVRATSGISGRCREQCERCRSGLAFGRVG